jgi:thiamine pyrophosphokinase
MAELVDALDSGSSEATRGCSSHLDRTNFWRHVFTQTRIAIISNAPIDDLSKIKEKITDYPALIAVDGGANHCHTLGLEPDLILGDFDSITPSTLATFAHLPVQRYNKDKDKTDLELALELAYHPLIEEIALFGALGGRTDHTLGNLVLLSRFPGKVFIESHSERLFVIKKSAQLSLELGQTLSLIPLNGPVHGITTTGLKWPLNDATLSKEFIGISNESTGSNVTISLREGDLLCCINYSI